MPFWLEWSEQGGQWWEVKLERKAEEIVHSRPPCSRSKKFGVFPKCLVGKTYQKIRPKFLP